MYAVRYCTPYRETHQLSLTDCNVLSWVSLDSDYIGEEWKVAYFLPEACYYSANLNSTGISIQNKSISMSDVC